MPLLITTTLIALAGGAWAQAPTARLQGTVQDPSGAVIPGAQVTAISSRTQIHSDAITNEEGFFLFAALQPDTYALSVTAPGFRPTMVRNIELIVGANEGEFVKLDIGPVTDTVSVDASAVRVQIKAVLVTSALRRRVGIIRTRPLPRRGSLQHRRRGRARSWHVCSFSAGWPQSSAWRRRIVRHLS